MGKPDWLVDCVSPDEVLVAAADTFRQRAQLYGDNYKHFGPIMAALFPRGLTAMTAQDWVRMGLVVQCVSKLTRYVENMHAGGHVDSAHDLAVYAAMLETETTK